MKTYFIEYVWAGKSFEWHHRCSGPVIALNEFHRFMQRSKQCDANRKVIRPKLQPGDYRICRLFERYYEIDGERKVIESCFDLPNSGNPDFRLVQTQQVEQPAFDFLTSEEPAAKTGITSHE